MSVELENIIKEIVDKRVKERYDEGFKSTTEILNRIDSSIKNLEKALETLEQDAPSSEQITRRFTPLEKDVENIKKSISKEELEDLMAKILLGLIPNFKETIAVEIKDHLVAIAEFVIENFREKD